MNVLSHITRCVNRATAVLACLDSSLIMCSFPLSQFPRSKQRAPPALSVDTAVTAVKAASLVRRPFEITPPLLLGGK